MKMDNKEFGFYWKIIEFPFYLLLLWTLAAFVISIFNFSLYLSIFSWYSNIIVSLAAFGIAGWSAVKDYKATIKQSAWSGAILGIVIGVVSSIIGIIMIYTVPAVIDLSLQRAIASGAQVSRETIISFIRIGAFIGLITGPLFNALAGAAMSAVAGLISKNTNHKNS
jgi:hypothetical protein